ncbi:unnamed protein product [Cercopithifilaria johnstoni]|uniref:Uncharacterized protein n=1 Tax=Cercopithifilaria johnstoni TaxID=2874296 RepID=A0A8J2MVR6_9BILA|nr:unnamed protein product [Cercopithifilaria johnstoni]
MLRKTKREQSEVQHILIVVELINESLQPSTHENKTSYPCLSLIISPDDRGKMHMPSRDGLTRMALERSSFLDRNEGDINTSIGKDRESNRWYGTNHVIRVEDHVIKTISTEYKDISA